jgi:hypothetical protein
MNWGAYFHQSLPFYVFAVHNCERNSSLIIAEYSESFWKSYGRKDGHLQVLLLNVKDNGICR